MPLNYVQEKVEKFIDKNRIHLSAKAVFDESLFADQKEMKKEITNGKIVLTNSVGKFLMQKGKIELYTKTEKDDSMTHMNFDCFVFSGDQLKEFVEMIFKAKGKIITLDQLKS
ncbi:MAG: hypothetical protein PF638_11160 [Candidatus Delongbacteria bacterium]|jgi:hypothetical protein|nr:hypothetical protein [Candidatus Delongbacteria bacterium]